MGARKATWHAAVLEVLQERAVPLSAYDILAELRKTQTKVDPPTVYRALAKLRERGLVHRLESLNAFIACACAQHTSPSILSICDDCGRVEENLEPDIISDLTSMVERTGFAAERHVIEVHGTCAACTR